MMEEPEKKPLPHAASPAKETAWGQGKGRLVRAHSHQAKGGI